MSECFELRENGEREGKKVRRGGAVVKGIGEK